MEIKEIAIKTGHWSVLFILKTASLNGMKLGQSYSLNLL